MRRACTTLDRPNHNMHPDSELRRFTIDANTGTVTARTFVDHTAELPQLIPFGFHGTYLQAASSPSTATSVDRRGFRTAERRSAKLMAPCEQSSSTRA